MDTRELTVRTASARGIADITPAVAAFLSDIGAADGLLSIFVPHATAGLVVVEVGAGSDDDLSMRSTGCCRARSGFTDTATGRPVTAPTTSCRSWPHRR